MASSGAASRPSRNYPGPTSEELATLVQRVIDAGSVARAGLITPEAPPPRKRSASSGRGKVARPSEDYGGPTREELSNLLDPEAELGNVTEVERALNYRRIMVRPAVAPRPRQVDRPTTDDPDRWASGAEDLEEVSVATTDRFLNQLDDIAANLRKRTLPARAIPRPVSEKDRTG